MKTIEPEFSRIGWHYIQVFRQGNVAIFQRSRLPDRTQEHFETVRLKPHGEFTIAGNTIEAGEAYPSSENWGTDGFTTHTRDEALEHAQRLMARREALLL